jgi:glycosyltransferase involved in cell wall biosynthesis
MRIVLMNQFFWPDTVATAQFLSDVAQVLAQENEVTAICSSTEESGKQPVSWLAPKLTILRAHGFRFSHRGLSRIASYISYVAGAIWHGMRVPGADVYLTLTTPPILSAIGSGFALLHGARHLIWEMDLYPDIANDIGYFNRGGIADRLVGAVLDWSRRRASAIIVLGAEMKNRLIARGIPEDKIHIAENWADGREICPQKLADGPFVVEYSGNLGRAHEVDTVLGVIGRLRNNPSFRFVFAGGGPKRRQLEAACRERGIRNVYFKPYCSRRELGKSLGEGHVGLVTQLPETVGSVVPSKIYGIMAAGRPILYIGPRGATPAEHIRRFKCGWHIPPGDVNTLERLLLNLNGNRHLVSQAGERARIAFEQNFDKSIGVERILKVIEGMNHGADLVPKLSPSAVGD